MKWPQAASHSMEDRSKTLLGSKMPFLPYSTKRCRKMNKSISPETFDTLIMDREPSNYSFPIQRPVSRHGCCKFPIVSADSSFFLARIMDFTCKKDRIADLPNRQKGFLFY